MAVASPERLRGDLVRIMHRGADVRDFSLGAARILARAVPFDGFCMLTLDPATLLPTGEVVENGLPQAATARMTEIEIRGEDFNTFDALARSERRAASLSEATGGDLDRSLRHRELKRPNGFGDELRAALVSDSATWGGFTLLRASDRRHFTPADATLVASVSGHLAEGLRRAILLAALPAERHDHEESAGLALLAPRQLGHTGGRRRRDLARRVEREQPGRTAPAGGRRRREPSTQHRGRARRDGRHRPRARPYGVRALAARARLHARRRPRRADGRDPRARPAA